MIHKVLVVDDEEIIRNLCKIILERNGFDVAMAVDGEQALELIHCCNFDLIITDLLMGGVNGIV
jgi:DNA-binding NtrC family response regulator